jgi:uncharacterized protein YegL
MALGKYLEDIESRCVNDQYMKTKTHEIKKVKAKKQRIQPKKDETKKVNSVKGSKRASTGQEKKDIEILKDFVIPSARPLPVIILADISGSMGTDGKIDILNRAIQEMIKTFASEEDNLAEICLCVVTFGQGGAKVHETLKPASEIKWNPLKPAGKTPMGAAFSLVTDMIEDKAVIPSRAYRPTIVLVSDGAATDDWKTPLQSLLSSERASKATRFVLGIGAEVDKETLTEFLANKSSRIFEAHEARDIKDFFKRVSMSVTSRSRSCTPNREDENSMEFEDLEF